MNAAKTILEGLFGYTVSESSRPNRWKLMKDGAQVLSWSPNEEELTVCADFALAHKYGSIKACAEKAAEWWNNSKFSGNASYEFDGEDWWAVSRLVHDAQIVQPLELIAEAVKAGWEG